MTDALQDIRDYFTDRFSSPFWVSFIVTWLLINWELPITAIFETDKFTVTFISAYLAKIPSWYTWQLPALLATTYAIFSSSVKEIIDILSKLIRSIFSYVDRKGKLYKSISLIEHEKEIARLERRLQKENKFKEELAEFSLENKRLEEENASLRLELKNREDYQNHNSKQAIEIDNLNKKLQELITQNTNEETDPIKKSINNKSKTSYLSRMKEYCDDTTMEKLSDPQSRASLLLVLIFLRHQLLYNFSDFISESGISQENLQKTIQLAVRAELLRVKSNGKYLLTDRGKAKLSELTDDEENHQIIRAIENINAETENQIIAILKKQSLTISEIKNLVQFNPNLLQVLNRLISINYIHKEGNVYFYGKLNKPPI